MTSILHKYLPNVVKIPDEFIHATKETLYMTFWTAILSGFFGLIFGVILVLTRPGGLFEKPVIYSVLDKVINVVRAIPFIILLALLNVVTRVIVGTGIGATAALVPLVVGVIPFFARQVEVALLEVDPGVIEAAESMGTGPLGIVFRVYLREGLPGLVRVSALTLINVIGLTAMAGAVGAGGLGNLAISRGYNRFQNDVTWIAMILILLMVFICQGISNIIVKKISH